MSDRLCGLCARLDAGFWTTRNGVQISPSCAACSERKGRHTHHFGPCVLSHAEKSACPRCGGRKALVDIPQSGRWEHQTYGRYCGDCFAALGWTLVTLPAGDGRDREVSWYEPPHVKDDLTGEQLIEMAGRSVASKRSRK